MCCSVVNIRKQSFRSASSFIVLLPFLPSCACPPLEGNGYVLEGNCTWEDWWGSARKHTHTHTRRHIQTHSLLQELVTFPVYQLQFQWSQMSRSVWAVSCSLLHVSERVLWGDFIHTSVPAQGKRTAAAHRHRNACLPLPVPVCSEDGEAARRFTVSHCYAPKSNKQAEQDPETPFRRLLHNPNANLHRNTSLKGQSSSYTTVCKMLLPTE